MTNTVLVATLSVRTAGADVGSSTVSTLVLLMFGAVLAAAGIVVWRGRTRHDSSREP